MCSDTKKELVDLQHKVKLADQVKRQSFGIPKSVRESLVSTHRQDVSPVTSGKKNVGPLSLSL